ncbi:MAG: NADH-quinone oxidoreductase subunit J [Chloroflexota bacterium]
MTPEMIIFILIALVTLGTAILVVTTRNILHAALWLIATLVGVACFYVLLNAPFFAMAQVIIYVGAIAILFIFAIMLVRVITPSGVKVFNEDWLMGLILACVFFGGMIWMLTRWTGFDTIPSVAVSQVDKINPVKLLGIALVSPNGYLIPFEVASVLLVAAMIGAIYIAWGKSLRNK